MILKFVAENVLSFDDAVEFSLVAAENTRRHRNHVIDLDGVRVLRGAVLYGANAAGKTNLLKALHLLETMFLTRSSACLRNRQFRGNGQSRPWSKFELWFSGDDSERIFKYTVQANASAVRLETLESLTDEQVLLKREGLTVRFPQAEDSWFQAQWDRTLRREILCFPALIDKGLGDNADKIKGAGVFMEALKGFRAFHVFSSSAEVKAVAFGAMLHVNEFRSFLLNLITTADVGIRDIEWTPVASMKVRPLFDQEIGPEDVRTRNGVFFTSSGASFFALEISGGKERFFELKFLHGKARMSGNEESEGTLRLLHMALFLFALANIEAACFVDEIDCHLHPFLAKYLLERFFDKYHARSQLVVTTHDTNLMNADLWRTDEIWFAEKRRDGSTDLYSMFQFAPRPGTNPTKGYLQGRYGAIPFLMGGNRL